MPASVCGDCYWWFSGGSFVGRGKPDVPIAFFALGGLSCSLALVQIEASLGPAESLVLERLPELTMFQSFDLLHGLIPSPSINFLFHGLQISRIGDSMNLYIGIKGRSKLMIIPPL